jgi:flagellar L-ring protein precursor FlgH
MKLFNLIAMSFIALSVASCSQMMGGLRPDLNDQQADTGPTQGGQWPEHGFLSEDTPEDPGAARYNSVGHSERGVASVGQQNGNAAWVSQDDANNNNRDAYRGDGNGAPAFSSNPNMAPGTRRQYRNGNRATAADFVDDSQNEGSLWASDGQTNYYFTKNKIRGVGDIISIKMEGGLIKDLGSEIKRTLTPNEKNAEIALAQDRIRQKALGASDGTTTAANGAGGPGGPAGAGAPGAPAPTDNSRAPASATGGYPEATAADIDVTKSLEVKDGDLVMAEIVERYPNGNYKIRGTKRIQYKTGTPRLMTLMAVARGTDIGEDDVINSGKLYEYQLEAFR